MVFIYYRACCKMLHRIVLIFLFTSNANNNKIHILLNPLILNPIKRNRKNYMVQKELCKPQCETIKIKDENGHKNNTEKSIFLC